MEKWTAKEGQCASEGEESYVSSEGKSASECVRVASSV